MSQLVIFRHGQSVWNLENKFTGWVDVELSEKGIEESKEIGEKLKTFKFDEGFASALKRTQQTLKIALEISGQPNIPLTFNKALNERIYGDLQGLNKTETEAKFGKEIVNKWRRSFDLTPPNGESLKDTFVRVTFYFEKVIKPKLIAGKNIVIVTHGNTMRALIMYLGKLTIEQIEKINIDTGEMRIYDFDKRLNTINVQKV